METAPWAMYLASVLVSILLVKTLLHSHRRKLNLPPGPKPWPIIGNLNLIGALPHRSIHALAQKYGPIMQLRFGSVPIVVSSSVDMAKLFLKTHDLNLASRPKTAAGKYTTFNYSGIAWSPYGPYWRQARKMCLMELFSAKRLESDEYIRVEEMRLLLRDLYEASGRTITLKDYLFTVSLNVISRMVLGKKYLDEYESAEFKKMIEEVFLLHGVLNIGDYIPWLDFLDLQGYIKRMKEVSKKFNKFLERVLDEHRERKSREGESFAVKDMVDVLLQQAENPSLEVKIEGHRIKAFILDVIAGATETSSETVEWAISELLRHPKLFERATEELDRVIGTGRWVEEKDMHNLPYIEAIMKEAMRMHPVTPILPPHLAREDCTIAGYDIPAGTRVLVNMWTIERDPEIWDAPDEFRPERFMGSKIDIKGQDFELLPFGSGRRMCPGYALGLKVIQMSLANLLHGFTWKLPEGMKVEELSMEEISGITTRRKVPLEAVIEPKHPAHLYVV